MKTRMIKRKGTLLSSVAMLGTAILLTACGGDGGDSPVDDFGSNPGEGDNQALLYAYPDNGQGEISTAAPVVLRFSSAVNLGQAQNSITLYEGDAETGTVVNTTPESVAKEPNNVLLQPDEDLKPNQTYTVVIEDLRLRKGTAKDQTLTFTTRPLHEGPKNLVVKEDTFEVSRRMPDGSEMEPVMDFSSFRLQFTQPIDRATAAYGESVTLTSSGGDTVDATLLIDGAYMTVDPDAEYLNAGETYTLDITADLASTYGETFGAESYTFMPKDSSPGREPAILVQKLTQGNTSRLTGKPINQVPVNGTLLGENKNITQASADVVRAELADVTTYTDVTPIRLPKGTVLNGAEIDPILIGGEVSAGFGSGDVTMTVLSDASGYLVPNPYAENNPDALRIVHLLMDVGIATSEARANGAFTQDLLHIELVGLAEVDPTAGVLNLDAVSVVEPNILGQEYGYGMLSFQLQSYKDQNKAPDVMEDNVAPTLQSWMPGDNESLHSPGDPIVLNFSEPLDKRTLEGSVSLFLNDDPIQFDYYVEGASLIIKPNEYIRYSEENDAALYRLVVGPDISDMQGNKFDNYFDEEFELPIKVEEKNVVTPASNDNLNNLIKHAPIVATAYPGFPCALTVSSLDLSSGWAGRCRGGFPGIEEGTPTDIQVADDLMPVMPVPPERDIYIAFSKEIDPNTVVYGKTFKVETVNELGQPQSLVEGSIDISPKSIRFTPSSGWEEDKLYSYTLKSGGYSILEGEVPAYIAEDSIVCDGTDAVCGFQGLPLQTQPLGVVQINQLGGANERTTQIGRRGPEFSAGGPNMVQYFKGGKPSSNVLQVLKALPDSDVNDNFFSEIDSVGSGFAEYTYAFEERGPTEVSDNAYPEFDPGGVIGSVNSAKILSRGATRTAPTPAGVNGASVGCNYETPLNFEDPETLDCPEHKFTYLSGALAAEVTDNVSNQGLEVLIWPTQIVGTSIPIAAPLRFFPGLEGIRSGETGPQFLRMRYAKDEEGNRTQPISAWIKSDSSGKPTLTAEVDLYLDAPYIAEYSIGIRNVTHNFNSFPITMKLTGQIEFLSDGRMTIKQENVDLIDLPLELYNSSGAQFGYADLFIPAFGSKLQFISPPIK